MGKIELYLERTEEVLGFLDTMGKGAKGNVGRLLQLDEDLAKLEQAVREDYFEFLQNVGQGDLVLEALVMIIRLLDKCEKIREDLGI